MRRERAKIQAQVNMLKKAQGIVFQQASLSSTEPMCVSLSASCLEQPGSFFHVSKGCCEAEGNTAAHLATGRNHVKVDLWLPKRACAAFWGPNFGTYLEVARQNSRFWVLSVLDGMIPVAPAKTDFTLGASFVGRQPLREGVEGY